jgi:predicted aspartyl protease
MRTFHTAFRVERYPDMSHGINVEHGLVDTGAEFTWVPGQRLAALGIKPMKSDSFTTADGKVIKREIGFAVVRLGKRFTADEVIFAQPGDLTLLGARSLEGLGLMIDERRKRLVAAGPAPAATAIRPAVARAMGIIVGPPRKRRKVVRAKRALKSRSRARSRR